MLLAVLLPLLSVTFIYTSSKMLTVLCRFLDENYDEKDQDGELLNKINKFTNIGNFFIGLLFSVTMGLISTFICSYNPDRF
jgi:hypothetical protein